MSRTIRSEYAAHQSQARAAAHHAQTRADWRAVLVARDAKRTGYHYRQARRGASVGLVRTSCAAVLDCICAVFSAVSHLGA